MADDTHPIPAVASTIWIRAHRDYWIAAEVACVGADGLISSRDDEGSWWDSPVDGCGESWRHLEDPPPPPASTFPDRDTVLRLMLAGAKAERERVLGIMRESAASTMAGVMWLDSPDGVAAKIHAGAPRLDTCADAIAGAAEVPRV